MSSIDRMSYEDGYYAGQEDGYNRGYDDGFAAGEQNVSGAEHGLREELKQLRDEVLQLLDAMDKDPEDLKISLQNVMTTIRVVDDILYPDNRRETNV